MKNKMLKDVLADLDNWLNIPFKESDWKKLKGEPFFGCKLKIVWKEDAMKSRPIMFKGGR